MISKQRFIVLDSFRGLCAISVVFFHMNIVGSLTSLSFFRNSHIFVEFFFILSGFVLSEAYGFNKEVNFYKFSVSRVFRIFPLHISMLVFFLIFEVCKLIAFEYYSFEFNNVPFTNSYEASQILPNLFLIQSWFPFFDATSFNYPSWSISVEFLLYLIFISTFIFSKYSKTFVWLLCSLTFLYLLNYNISFLTNELQRGIAFFFLGASLNALQHKISFIKLNRFLASSLESAVLVLVIFFVSENVDGNYLLAACLFSLMIIVFSFEAGFLSRLLATSKLQLLGRLSYSIYMVHCAVLILFLSFFMIFGKVMNNNFTPVIEGERYLNTGNDIFNNILCFIIVFVVIYVSSITNRYIEKPCINLGRIIIKKNCSKLSS